MEVLQGEKEEPFVKIQDFADMKKFDRILSNWAVARCCADARKEA